MTPLALATVAAVSAWLGIMAFFSFIAAPTLFRSMERGAAATAAAAVLPGYYVCGVVLSAVALVASVARLAKARSTGTALAATAVLSASMLGLGLWSLLVVLPAAEAARGARDSTAFALAHRRAVSLNGLAMLCGAAALGVELVTRRRAGPSAIPPGA